MATRTDSAEHVEPEEGRAPSRPELDGAGRPAASEGRSESGGAPPRVADGVELIGEYRGSGLKEAPYLVRRADGQVLQLTRLLYLVAEALGDGRTYDQVAERVTEGYGRSVSADNVRTLVEDRLRPLGVVTGPGGESPDVEKADPLLALKFRTKVVPERLVNAITFVFRPLFFPPVILAVLAGLVAFDIWLFGVHGVGEGLRRLLYQPAYLLLTFGLVVLSGAFHEIGHAVATRYGGAKPGVMGVGIYIVWPAFYTDVTDTYRLSRGARLRVDFGGIYFNMIFSLATAGAYFLTGAEALLIVIVVQHLEMLRQLMPFLRMDGYYIIADLTGVPDMFSRVKPVLASLLPWRKADARVRELKPWVRVAVTVWVALLIPILLYTFGLMLVTAPRLAATAYDSLLVQSGRIGDEFAAGSVAMGLFGIVQCIALVLPIAGIALMLGRVGRRAATGGWRRTAGRPVARTAFVIAMAGVVGAIGWLWWPNGEYRPIQEGESFTLTDATSMLVSIDTGRPGLTEERQESLGGAPLASEQTTDEGGTTTVPDPVPSSSPTTDPTEDPTSSPSPSPTPEETTAVPSPTTSPTAVVP